MLGAVPVKKRPRKPKRKHPGITAIYSGGRWKWRAVLKIDGVQTVGSLQTAQEAAYDDYRAMKLTHGSLPRVILKVEQALTKVIRDARQRGVSEDTITKQYKAHGNYLLRYFKPTTELTRISKEEVEWFVGEAMSAADITAAAVVFRVRDVGIFPLPPAAEALFGWVERVTRFASS